MKKLLDPIVSMHYENGEPVWRANCPKCGAMVFETCGSLPLKEVLEMERPYCQHCGTHLSAKFEMNEARYCVCKG